MAIGPAIGHIRTFFVEEPKSARKLLRELSVDFPLQQCAFLDLNEHTTETEVSGYIPLIKGEDTGIISESGCPCVADPGADLVFLAHRNNVEVVPLVGPSSILLAVMASGLGGQNFAFNGYLPKTGAERIAQIRFFEKRAVQERQTQIFMETPYRNQDIFDDMLKACGPKTSLCVACDLTGSEQFIKTRPIDEWRKSGLLLPKKPALFIIR